MSVQDQQKFKELFLQTAGGHIGIIKKGLSDSTDPQSLEKAYISAHSLKSQSQVMGYMSMAQIALIIEKTLKAIQKDIPTTKQLEKQKLLDLTTFITDNLEAIKTTGNELNSENIIKKAESVFADYLN